MDGELTEFAVDYESENWDPLTLDVTLIATGLGQLMDEGRIDTDAKPIIEIAIRRQRIPGSGPFDSATLDAIERVIRDA